jgi:hypothetical protein
MYHAFVLVQTLVGILVDVEVSVGTGKRTVI